VIVPVGCPMSFLLIVLLCGIAVAQLLHTASNRASEINDGDRGGQRW
jgi:hypothetical protein